MNQQNPKAKSSFTEVRLSKNRLIMIVSQISALKTYV